MIVVFSTFVGDIANMKRLLAWMEKLGEHKDHDALICTFGDTPFDLVIELRELASKLFREVRMTAAHERRVGWPGDPNVLFRTAATFINEQWPQPFLIMEADAVPMRSNWLNDIAAEYASRQCKFLGHIYECHQPFLPSRLMSGIAIYPPDSAKILPLLKDSPRAWDVDGAEVMVANGEHTTLIHHFWGQPNLPPTFVTRKDANSPVNAMTLEDIPRDASLYHRNKDGTLIRLLERKLFPHEFQRQKLSVCFPVYQGDIGLAILHANWLRKLGQRWQNEAIICHEPSCPVTSLNQFEQLLRHSFATVNSFVYPRPPIPSYPHVANWMFQSIALHMAKQKSPWLLFEADAVVLKADWVEQLQNEYNRVGMPWMGPHVKGMHHANGSMIYPADAAARMPRAMSCSDQAWDYHGWEDYMPWCHDASHLLHHVWSLVNGQLCEVGGGQVPANATVELLNQIPKSCVVSHRWKDASVLNLLLRGEFKP